MPAAMEQRLDRVVHELNEIKKEMILLKVQPAVRAVRKINAFHSKSTTSTILLSLRRSGGTL